MGFLLGDQGIPISSQSVGAFVSPRTRSPWGSLWWSRGVSASSGCVGAFVSLRVRAIGMHCWGTRWVPGTPGCFCVEVVVFKSETTRNLIIWDKGTLHQLWVSEFPCKPFCVSQRPPTSHPRGLQQPFCLPQEPLMLFHEALGLQEPVCVPQRLPSAVLLNQGTPEGHG